MASAGEGRYAEAASGRLARREQMADENQGPAGGVTAHLTIAGGRGEEAVKFYENAFSAHEEMRHMADDGERIMHAHLQLNCGSLMRTDDVPEYRGGGDARAPSRAPLH